MADLNQILIVLDLDTVEGQRIFNRIPHGLQEQVLKSLQNNQQHLQQQQTKIDEAAVTAAWAQWPDGLTAPMKSAKQRRFAPRPLHAANVGELERIEREVERLLKSDGQAIESKFSLFSGDGNVILGDSDILILEEEGEGINVSEDTGEGEGVEGEREEGEGQGEGEDYSAVSSSSASDIEDMNDLVAEIEDNLLSHPSEVESPEKTPEIFISETDKLVKDLEAKLMEKLKQAESVSNPLIKARIEDVIRQLEDNLKNLKGKE